MMSQVSQKTIWIVVVAVVVALAILLVYWSGNKGGGVRSQLDAISQQNKTAQQATAAREAAAQQATRGALEEAAKAANPLTVENPLKRVKAASFNNPFQ